MKKIALFILLIVCYACSGSKESNYEMIDLEIGSVQVEELSVKDLGEGISYVPLETTDKSLIGKRAYVRLLKDKLLVGSFQQPIKMFDKETGKFIRIVGNIGQGTNEYTLQDGIPVFWTDDALGIIYVQTEGTNVVRFDVNGNLLHSVCLPDSFPLLTTASQATIENKLYVYKQTLFNKKDYKIYMYDIPKGKIGKYFLNEDEAMPLDFSQTPLFLVGFGNIPVSTSCNIFTLKDGRMILSHTENPCFWFFDKNIYFKENFNDTIYQIEDYKLNPRFVFNLGDKHCDYRDRFKVEGSQNKIAIDYILEGQNVLFFVFQTNYYNLKDAKTYLGVYNKKDKSVKVTNKLQIKDTEKDFFIEKFQTATSDGQLVTLVDAAFFAENTNDKGISEDDNPIVVIVE